ncbi:SusC/RagA family TonB-linked outer membrane protein [Pseudoflavitalea sp. G-6-1-2]|uniref:SusC/RagA family TonB-linked outer membrane protein n=1 Tax=Pseudoflavitalea sp. G-6-1-2 TaxID=2728841 RepID=UPI00146F12DC|nr:SusC/RagA family TonB-linked outer membrane protein [Pseudoflavitalea sp. G-6-1-2]NML21209.1 SusC/RagA family TonB-linked outer membrane protein [Pseudoflavitalea sp. G-6-1-2]
MKLTTVLLTACFLQVSATGLSQKVSFSAKETTLEAVFASIEKQTDFVFLYSKAAIRNAKPVTLEANDVELKQFLAALFRWQPLEYFIEGKSIFISPKRTAIVQPSNVYLPELADTLITVSGRIRDAVGNPVARATVRVKGASQSTYTADNGTFYLSRVNENATLIISNVGFETQEIRLKPGQRVVETILKVSVRDMDQVVVSTGIFKKEDKSFTGASRTVTNKELKQFGNRNLIVSLRNIDPSFNIIESNLFGSDPNRLPEIQIRGNSSIPNVNEIRNESNAQLNTPLIILDGFQSTLQALLNINENDVESITILKDAAATAIYGSRGANGVVVITTRMPKPGKLRVSFGTNINLETADLSGYSLLKGRDKLELERLAGYYEFVNTSDDLPLKRYYSYLLDEVNRGVETDWMALPLRNAYGMRNNIRIEGGDNQFRYSAAFQTNNVAGVMKGSDRKTTNGTITLSYTYRKLLFRNYLNISSVKSRQSPYGAFGDYVKQNPYWAPYDENGKVNKFLGNPGNTDWIGRWRNLPTNPLYNATLHTFDKSNQTAYTNNTTIEWRINNDLRVRAQLGITKSQTQTDKFRPADHTAFANYSGQDIFRKGDYAYSVNNAFSYDGSLNLTWSTIIGQNHNLFAGADFNIRQNEASSYRFLAEGFPNERLDFITMGQQYAKGGKPTGDEALSRALGFVGNVNYNYANRYFADVVFRVDGSSQFGSRKRFAPFWSVGLGWNIHEEKFFNANSVVNRLKLRGSVGITGSTNFNAYQAMTTYAYFTDDRYYNWNGTYQLGYGNKDLQWQQALKYNVGTDIELFNRYLMLNGEYYIETTNDLISSVNTPASNGFSYYTANIGKLRNQGFELRATGYLMKKPKGLTWSVTGAVLQNRNKVISTSAALKDAQKSIRDLQTDPGQLFIEGYSSNTIWVVRSLGIDPSTGNELFLRADGTPTYTWSGNDVMPAGTTEPDLFGNFGTMLRYKGFTLNTSFRFRLGGQMYNQTLVERVESNNFDYNMDERSFFGRWQKPGDQAPFKGIRNTKPTYKSSRFVQNENTLVMQNINLQYDFRNAKWLTRMGIENINISADMAEPMYISTVRRERGTTYPFSRQFSLSLNATF